MEGRSCRWSVVTLAAAIACALSGVAGATNGYFKQGYGAQNKAMGGVGMAVSLDAYAPGTNAAGIAAFGDFSQAPSHPSDRQSGLKCRNSPWKSGIATAPEAAWAAR